MFRLLSWPFRMVWGLLGFMFGLMGRVLTIIIGLLVMVVGVLLTVTIVGSFLGIPLIILGFLLAIRALF